MKTAGASSRPLPRMVLLLTAAMLVLIVYFGLRFKDTAITNDVDWLEGAAGIRFERNSIVYADRLDLPSETGGTTPSALSIELALKSDGPRDGHFQFVLLLHGGQDDRQLVIGQWRSWLIVMNGDDYDARRRQPRIAVEALQAGKIRFVTVTSGKDGTVIHLDGRPVRRKPGLTLRMPDLSKGGHLVLGNSIYGRHAWAGDLYGLALYPRVLDPAVIDRHYDQWRRTGTFARAAADGPSGLYLFDEKGGAVVADQSGAGNHLAIPQRMAILNKEFLSAPFVHEGNKPSLVQDMVINLAGFVPMGFLLSALLCGGRCRAFGKRLGWVMLVCGGLSLGIELAQAWIPTRSSQMLDLILNTLGAGLGVLLHRAYRRVLPPHRSAS